MDENRGAPDCPTGPPGPLGPPSQCPVCGDTEFVLVNDDLVRCAGCSWACWQTPGGGMGSGPLPEGNGDVPPLSDVDGHA